MLCWACRPPLCRHVAEETGKHTGRMVVATRGRGEVSRPGSMSGIVNQERRRVRVGGLRRRRCREERGNTGKRCVGRDPYRAPPVSYTVGRRGRARAARASRQAVDGEIL